MFKYLIMAMLECMEIVLVAYVGVGGCRQTNIGARLLCSWGGLQSNQYCSLSTIYSLLLEWLNMCKFGAYIFIYLWVCITSCIMPCLSGCIRMGECVCGIIYVGMGVAVHSILLPPDSTVWVWGLQSYQYCYFPTLFFAWKYSWLGVYTRVYK